MYIYISRETGIVFLFGGELSQMLGEVSSIDQQLRQVMQVQGTTFLPSLGFRWPFSKLYWRRANHITCGNLHYCWCQPHLKLLHLTPDQWDLFFSVCSTWKPKDIAYVSPLPPILDLYLTRLTEHHRLGTLIHETNDHVHASCSQGRKTLCDWLGNPGFQTAGALECSSSRQLATINALLTEAHVQ